MPAKPHRKRPDNFTLIGCFGKGSIPSDYRGRPVILSTAGSRLQRKMFQGGALFLPPLQRRASRQKPPRRPVLRNWVPTSRPPRARLARATKGKKAPQAKKAAKPKEGARPREGSKTERILDLLKRGYPG